MKEKNKTEKKSERKMKKIIFISGIILILLIALLIVFLIFKEKVLLGPVPIPGFPSEEVAKQIIAQRSGVVNEVLTCQKDSKLSSHTSLCNSKRCSATSKYVGCSSYTSGSWINKKRYYQEICQTTYTTACTQNPKCSSGEKEISRVKCCTPNCAGKTCGDNDCGGNCGTCASGSSCATNGICVTTNTNNLRIFITSGSSNGNLGGVAGADTRCMSDGNNPDKTKTWKALIGSSTRQVGGSDWVLKSNMGYYKSDRTTLIGETNDVAWFKFPLNNLINPSVLSVWTGLTASGAYSSASSCSGWTSRSGYGFYGKSNYQDSKIVNIGSAIPCVSSLKLSCVEQP